MVERIYLDELMMEKVTFPKLTNEERMEVIMTLLYQNQVLRGVRCDQGDERLRSTILKMMDRNYGGFGLLEAPSVMDGILRLVYELTFEINRNIKRNKNQNGKIKINNSVNLMRFMLCIYTEISLLKTLNFSVEKIAHYLKVIGVVEEVTKFVKRTVAKYLIIVRNHGGFSWCANYDIHGGPEKIDFIERKGFGKKPSCEYTVIDVLRQIWVLNCILPSRIANEKRRIKKPVL